MARLQPMDGGDPIVLFPRTFLGRSRRCEIRIDKDQDVSAIHATVFWSGGVWWLQDLSTNGTWLDDTRIEVGRRVPLSPGVGLRLAARHRFRVLDVDPPTAVAVDDAGIRCHALSGVLTLPPGDHPHASVYRNAAGQWVVDRGAGETLLADDEELILGEERWRLHLPEGAATFTSVSAVTHVHLLDVTLVFEVQGPQVQLSLEHEEGTVVLERRSYHHTLLALARERIDDPDGGWLHLFDLAERIDPDAPDPLRVRARLEVHMHRARRQLANEGIWGAERLVERRQGLGELRLGVAKIRIREPGGEV